jgi:hypothetical protein
LGHGQFYGPVASAAVEDVAEHVGIVNAGVHDPYEVSQGREPFGKDASLNGGVIKKRLFV